MKSEVFCSKGLSVFLCLYVLLLLKDLKRGDRDYMVPFNFAGTWQVSLIFCYAKLFGLIQVEFILKLLTNKIFMKMKKIFAEDTPPCLQWNRYTRVVTKINGHRDKRSSEFFKYK